MGFAVYERAASYYFFTFTFLGLSFVRRHSALFFGGGGCVSMYLTDRYDSDLGLPMREQAEAKQIRTAMERTVYESYFVWI